MRTSELDYELPAERIAQTPAARRDRSRLLVLRRSAAPPEGRLEHRRFDELPDLLSPDDLLVLNDARVLPARLRARRRTGGRVELLLVEPVAADPDGRGAEEAGDGKGGAAELGDGDGSSSGVGGAVGGAGGGAGRGGPRWRALARPLARLSVGETLILRDTAPEDRIEGPEDRGPSSAEPGSSDTAVERIELVAKHEDGSCTVAFPGGCDVEALLEERGEMPLPPYIDRTPEDPRRHLDRRRYQTVYADRPGAVAAPTAGLHFTERVLDELTDRGIRLARLTLEVGPGTFRPVQTERVEDHEMEPEAYEIPEVTARALAETRASEGRVVAVGTTVVRALEHSGGSAGTGRADLFIRPGYEFRVVDGMLTNFHLPRSTPLFLVAALVGPGPILRAYGEAVESGYRFYSYGDAMLIL